AWGLCHFFLFQTEDGIRDRNVTGVQTCALPIYSKLTVAVEYCKPNQTRKKNNFYFAFNNPKLEMITGGAWEMNIYPHLPIKYKPKNIDFIYFIIFNDKIYQCEIITIDDI